MRRIPAAVDRTKACAVMLAVLLIAGCIEATRAAPGPAHASDAPDDAFAAARIDLRPVLIAVRDPDDVASVDLGHWLRDPAVAGALGRVHATAPWTWRTEPRPYAALPGRLALFTVDGHLIAMPPIPQRRGELGAALGQALADPRPLDALAADPAATVLAARRLIEAGRADRVPAGIAGAVAYDADELAALARLHWAARLERASTALAGRALDGAAPASALAPLAELVADIASPLADDSAAATLAEVAALGADDAKRVFDRVARRVESLAQIVGDDASRRIVALAARRRDLPRVQAMAIAIALERPADTDLHAAFEAAVVAAWPADAEGDLVGAIAAGAIRLGSADARRRAAEVIDGRIARGRDAADALMDLADDALGAGARAEAEAYWARAIDKAADGASPAYAFLAPAMRALAAGQRSPAGDRFLARRALDVVVLVHDLPSFARAVARWDAETFFPVLFDDGDDAARFIAEWRPARVVRIAPAPAPDALDLDTARGVAWSAWNRATAVAPLDEQALRERSRGDGTTAPADGPPGVVFSDGGDGLAGALALAAGRFEPLVGLPAPARLDHDGRDRPTGLGDALTRAEAESFARAVRDRLAAFGAWRDDRWTAVTLAGAYPFRWDGDVVAHFGTTACLDDLVGRDDDLVRHAVAGRLQGPRARAAYQAMCALFLRPDDALLFNTYGLDPASAFGQYTLAPAEAAWHGLVRVTSLQGDAADIHAFRRATHPRNAFGLVAINSSGGATDWTVPGGGGTTDDIFVGSPSVVHVTHSGSAADPYDGDTLAGRALSGGAYAYFGSIAEPYLQSFQPSRIAAPRIAAGAPYAFAFRKRHGQYAARPWRLIFIGDPLAALRHGGVQRVAAPSPLIDADERDVPVAEAGRPADPPPGSPAAALAAREAAAVPLDAAWQAKDPAALIAALPALLATAPADAFVARWLDDAITLARGAGTLAEVRGWLAARAADPADAHWRDAFAGRAAALGIEAALAMPEWDEATRRAVVADLAVAVRGEQRPRALAERLAPALDAWCRRVPGATPATLVLALTPLLDSERVERLRAALVALDDLHRQSRAWALLGPVPGAADAAVDALVVADDRLAGVARGDTRWSWWQPYAAGDSGPVDLAAALAPHATCCAYATTRVVADRDIDAWLLVGADGGIAAWLDGARIWDDPTMRGRELDQDHVPLHLTAGAHRLVVRIAHDSAGWELRARLAADETGAPLVEAKLVLPR